MRLVPEWISFYTIHSGIVEVLVGITISDELKCYIKEFHQYKNYEYVCWGFISF